MLIVARHVLHTHSTVPALRFPFHYQVQITVAMLRATIPSLQQYHQVHRHIHTRGLLLLRTVRLITVLVSELTLSRLRMSMDVQELHQLLLSVLLWSSIFLSLQAITMDGE